MGKFFFAQLGFWGFFWGLGTKSFGAQTAEVVPRGIFGPLNNDRGISRGLRKNFAEEGGAF